MPDRPTPTPEEWLATLKAYCDSHPIPPRTMWCGCRVHATTFKLIEPCSVHKAPDHDPLQATQDVGDSAV